MKKFCLTVLAIAAIIVTIAVASGAYTQASVHPDYLRIHVRANSNEQIDQDIKYKVKDEVVKFITPYAAECVDKPTAMKVIGGILEEIEAVCNNVLKANGFNYTSRAQIREEEFPTRVYGDLTLENGIYDALIIELGSGTGDNWWCVIYPPLCFTASTSNVEYRSAIKDIINYFFAK